MAQISTPVATIQRIPLLVEEALPESNTTRELPDYLILHQSNRFIIGRTQILVARDLPRTWCHISDQ